VWDVWYLARVENVWNVFKCLVGKTDRRSLFKKLRRRRWNRNVRVDFTEIRRVMLGGMKCDRMHIGNGFCDHGNKIEVFLVDLCVCNISFRLYYDNDSAQIFHPSRGYTFQCKQVHRHLKLRCLTFGLTPFGWLQSLTQLPTSEGNIIFRRFRKIAKTISFVMYVLLSIHIKELASRWMGFRENLYLIIFLISVEKIQISLKSNNNYGYFTRRPMHIYQNTLLNSSTNEMCFRRKL
jgi:hypothetical protein